MALDISDGLRQKLRMLPDKPGCYIMRDRYGHIIYVGKAASLRRRVQSYFRTATFVKAPPKVRGLIRSIVDFDIIVVKTEADAILTEGQLIKDYRPRYNTLFKDDKRFPLLRVDLNQPFPKFRLCRLERADGAHYFGPYANSSAARVALEFVEKRFGVRKCTPLVPTERDHQHCINDIVRFCSAPCMGKVTPDEYRARIDEACAFLRGERQDILLEVEAAMLAASKSTAFEKAAALRDTLYLLRTAVHKQAHVSRKNGVTEEGGVSGMQALRVALGLAHDPRIIECFDISNISGTYSVASMVAAVDGIPRPTRYRRFRIKTVQSIDDPAMMAEVVRRRYGRLLTEGGSMPDMILVDGGITQLRAAQSVLKELGLDHVPLAGLAKRFEEIIRERDGQPESLVLPANSPALQVLQRLRDEAHRFALAYHHRLREKRIRESVLDDIPGIGPNRKEQLLRRFGSVLRLARASEDEIAAVTGVGAELARLIKQHIATPP